MLNLRKTISLVIFSGLIFSHGISESDKNEIVQGSLIDYLYLGAKHMITGYDHILFLIGVIFFLTRFSDIVKFITAFTIGHSITLILATLFKITANYYLIDAIIAFSVIYKGFENCLHFSTRKQNNVVCLLSCQSSNPRTSQRFNLLSGQGCWKPSGCHELLSMTWKKAKRDPKKQRNSIGSMTPRGSC